MNNCKFEDNNATNGGAIYFASVPGILSNLEFTRNHADGDGGAMYYYSDASGTAQSDALKESTFTDNTAGNEGGALYLWGSNGKIEGNVFTGNNATDDGGAIMIKGSNWRISNSTFNSNAAINKRGGAIYLEDAHYSYIDGCSFDDNVAGTNGGAIDWHDDADHGNVMNSNFTHNIAKRSGGAIFWYGINGTVTDSIFTYNHALGQVLANDSYGNETYGGFGGAIMWTGAIGDIIGSTFKYNEAHYNGAVDYGGRGGAIYLQGSKDGECYNTTFNKCIFIGNIAGTNGGAIDWHEGARDGLINNSVFEDNKANSNGGAVYWRGHHGDIYNSNFTNNTALGVRTGTYKNIGDGGAIFWAGINGTVVNCRFIDNEAIRNKDYNMTGRGGAVYLGRCEHGNDNTTFTDCYFFNNTAGTNGGAIDWHEGANDGLVDNCTFINNTAKRSAGAIFWNGHNGTIQYSRFYGNKALGIENASSVHGETTGEITFGGDAGAVMWSGSLGDVLYCNFVNNTAAKRGGAVFLQGSDIEKKCENTTFKNSYFANNIAGSNGGAIDWNKEAIHGLVDNVTFFNNTAGRSGGAIFWNGYNGTVKNSKFINNRATGTFLEYMNMTLSYENVIIINDDKLPATSTLKHDKLYVLNYTIGNGQLKFESWVLDENDQPLKIDETVVRQDDGISPVDWGIDQYFGGDGGTILWSGDVGLVYNCTFIGSNSARRGGGAYMTGSDNVTYNYCNFTNCTSGTNGGGLDWLAGANDGRIYNCIFNHTRAARSAGAIYYDGDNGRMENITIIGTKSWGGSLPSDRGVNYAGWDSSHWDTNTTGGDAGAIMITGDNEYLYNVTFINCTATGRGGAVFLQHNTNVTFDSCKFINNTALGISNNTYYNDLNTSSGHNQLHNGRGGAIAFDFNATDGKIKNSEFTNNLAYRDGGALSFAEGANGAQILNSTFTNNTAKRSGGAMFWYGENGTVKDSKFYNNRATGEYLQYNMVLT